MLEVYIYGTLLWELIKFTFRDLIYKIKIIKMIEVIFE